MINMIKTHIRKLRNEKELMSLIDTGKQVGFIEADLTIRTVELIKDGHNGSIILVFLDDPAKPIFRDTSIDILLKYIVIVDNERHTNKMNLQNYCRERSDFIMYQQRIHNKIREFIMCCCLIENEVHEDYNYNPERIEKRKIPGLNYIIEDICYNSPADAPSTLVCCSYKSYTFSVVVPTDLDDREQWNEHLEAFKENLINNLEKMTKK
jgi:hypothetical protein